MPFEMSCAIFSRSGQLISFTRSSWMNAYRSPCGTKSITMQFGSMQ
jgi:hypothetical protein